MLTMKGEDLFALLSVLHSLLTHSYLFIFEERFFFYLDKKIDLKSSIFCFLWPVFQRQNLLLLWLSFEQKYCSTLKVRHGEFLSPFKLTIYFPSHVYVCACLKTYAQRIFNVMVFYLLLNYKLRRQTVERHVLINVLYFCWV